MTPGDGFFAEIAGGADPAAAARGRRPRRHASWCAAPASPHDPALAERIVHLAESEGLETLAEVWSGAPADTLAGSLWRLFLLRSWVHADPERVAPRVRGRAAPRRRRPRRGRAWPTRPVPTSCAAMVDDVLRGIAGGDFAVTLFRAAAFARIVAAGRASLGTSSHEEITRMLVLSEQLEAAGHVELDHGLL